MSAEGILHNPSIFTGKPITVWQATREYVELAREHPCPFSYVRGHVFKFLQHCLAIAEHAPLRNKVAKTHSLDDLLNVADELEKYYSEDYEKFATEMKENLEPKDLPVYFCKPYFRPPPTEFNSKIDGNDNEEVVSRKAQKRQAKSLETNKKLKKELQSKIKSSRQLCVLCPNPKGSKCDYECCRKCCRNKTFVEVLDCEGENKQFFICLK